ncbi:MAG: ResB protein required for cytochrome C biosynthesis [Gemmataceae bacterium]|nr:ResB protein required for cytochrome C biosynthesis [Gemmataceae bacterium]
MSLDQNTPEAPREQSFKKGFLLAVKAIASLRLTVSLFVLSFFLVFVGTLAQVENPTWTVVTDYFRSLVVWVPNQLLARFCQTFRWISPTAQWPGGFFFPGGWTLGSLLLINLLAAHLMKFQLSWRRSGILLIHAGLILLMVSELVTGLFAVEGNMTIEQGGAANYLELRETSGFLGKINGPELAFSDPSNPDKENVTVIPNRILRQGGKISHPALPCDVEVISYMANSTLKEIDPESPEAKSNPASKGDGLQFKGVDKKEMSGTAKDQKVDIPSAYIQLKDKATGQSLGTYLVSLWLSLSTVKQTQEVTLADGKKLDLALRFKRAYKPYTVELLEFKHEVYLGTTKPRNFSSRVKLLAEQPDDSRETLISMNNPLRHAGETFYQSGFLPGDKGTILQVVRNPGWLIPYFSCFLAALGMLIHFGQHLNSFLAKRRG